MFRLRPRFLARALTVAATLPALATVQATTIVPAEGMQSAGASLHHSILSIGTPPVTPTFPVQQSLRLTPGSTPSMMSPGGPVDYLGGSGVAAEAFVNGPAVFAPDVVRPFLGETWAAASARTGQIRAQVHGSMFEQTRSLPRPDGGSYQFDRVGANYGNASGSISNVWTMELDRQAIFTPRPDGSRQYNPLQFGITLDVETRVAVNTANAFVFTPWSVDPGTVGLFFSISFERLLILDGSPRPETLPDGSPSVVTHTQRFEFDASQQGRRTLRFEYAADAAYRWPAPPRSFWFPGTGADFNYQDGLPHMCFEGYEPGTAWGDYCPVKITTIVGMYASSAYDLAEGSVSATWDARIGGGTDGIHRIITSADQWGQPLDPTLVLGPSLLTPVPEPQAWAMLLVGLSALTWRRRVRGPSPGVSANEG